MKNKNKSIFIITTFSPYENREDESKKINFKALEKELKLIESRNKAPVVKKSLKKMAIANATKDYTRVFNPIGDSSGFGRSQRSHMFFYTLKEAESAIKQNYADLLEGGSYGNPTLICIEEYKPGFCMQIMLKRFFYQAVFYKKKNKKGEAITSFKINKIKTPKWAKGVTNYGLG